MKTLGLALVLLPLMANPTMAVKPEALPVFCDDTSKVFDQLKIKKFKPVIIGNVEKLYSVIMVNDSKDMVMTFTMQHEGKATTCIFIGGAGNTDFLEFDKFIEEQNI